MLKITMKVILGRFQPKEMRKSGLALVMGERVLPSLAKDLIDLPLLALPQEGCTEQTLAQVINNHKKRLLQTKEKGDSLLILENCKKELLCSDTFRQAAANARALNLLILVSVESEKAAPCICMHVDYLFLGQGAELDKVWKRLFADLPFDSFSQILSVLAQEDSCLVQDLTISSVNIVDRLFYYRRSKAVCPQESPVEMAEPQEANPTLAAEPQLQGWFEWACSWLW